MRSLLLALPALFPLCALACINTYDLALQEYPYYRDREKISAQVTALEKKLQEGGDYKVANDLAVALMLFGNYPRAIELLEGIESKHPGEKSYRTAANLGTAYELNGQDDKALSWIQEGVRRNPDDHQGTEWLHARIIEAKLAIAKEPGWLKTHYVAGVDFGDGDAPRMPVPMPTDFLGNGKSLEALGMALTYQLKERMKFVDRPNAVVADLLLSRGDAQYLLEVPQHHISYELAWEYASDKPELLKKRLDYIVDTYLTRAAVCGALLAIVFIYGRRRRVNGTQAAAGDGGGPSSRGGDAWARGLTLVDRAYSTPFYGIRPLMWVLVVLWGVVWLASPCVEPLPVIAGLLVASTLAAAAHGWFVLRRPRPAFTLAWPAWKWVAADLAGVALLALVYAAPFKVAQPAWQCGGRIASSALEPATLWTLFVAAFLATLIVWSVGAKIGSAARRRRISIR